VCLNIENVTDYTHLLLIAAICFGRTWTIIRQRLLLEETTALYTLSFVVVIVVNMFYRIFLSYSLSSHICVPF
jgi:hypothetical protein